jgi:hypothetical protein
MKREISNEKIQTLPVFLFLGLTIASLVNLFFFDEYSLIGKAASIVLFLVFGIVQWYLSTKFYKVSFDSDFLYFSHFQRTQKKVGLEHVLDIIPIPIPIRVFWLNSYIVTITYLENDDKKKVRFFSKGAFENLGSIKGIPHLEKLRQCVLDKKYGRSQSIAQKTGPDK